MRQKGGLYDTITLYFSIAIIIGGLLFFMFFGEHFLMVEEKVAGDVMQKNSFRAVRDRLVHCYGLPSDVKAIDSEPGCMGLSGDRGISLEVVESPACEHTPITAFPYRGSGDKQQYAVPLRVRNNTCPSCMNNQTCPGRLTVYEEAHVVPLITDVAIDPIISPAADPVTANVTFHHVKDPSFISMDVYDSTGTHMLADSSGALTGTDQASFTFPTSSWSPGIYELRPRSTHDKEFYSVRPIPSFFRVLDPSATPSFDGLTVTPPEGSIYQTFDISVNLSDVVNITNVEVAVKNGSNVVSMLPCNRTSRSFDDEDVSYSYTYSCSWSPISMPNTNFTYNLTVIADNSLGNTLTKPHAGTLRIIREPSVDLIVVAIEEYLQSVYSSSDISSLESKVQDYFSALGSQGLVGRYFYLDGSDVQDVTGTKLSGGIPYSYNDIDAVIEALQGDLSPSYILIVGGDNVFPHAQVPSISSGTDDVYGDNNSDELPDAAVGRVVDPTNGDMTLLLDQFDTFIDVHTGGGLDFSSYAANGMNAAWTSATCYNEHVWGSQTTAHAKIGTFPCDLSDADGKGFFMHLMHGSDIPQYYSCSPGECGCTSSINPSDISFTDIDGLVWFTMACYGGKTSNKPTTAESIPMEFFSNGGGAYIGSTDLNYGGKESSCLTESGSLVGDVYVGALYTMMTDHMSTGTRLGDAYIAGKEEYYNNVEPSASLHDYQTHINILYGDPTLKITSMW